MLIQFTLCGLVILLIAVIALSYYVNKEAFANIKNAGISGRYIKLELQQVGCMNLADIKVFSTKTGPNIITPATVVTKSSGYQGDQAPGSNFVDGNLDTIVHTSCADQPWILVDLGSVIPIYKIVVTNRKDCCRQRTNNMILSILDGSQKEVYRANPIGNKDTYGAPAPFAENSEEQTNKSRYYYTFTWFPPNKQYIGDARPSDDLNIEGFEMQLACRNLYTPWNYEGGGNAIYLDRHDVKCDKNEVLSQFHLTRQAQEDGNIYYRYDYKCCALPDSEKGPKGEMGPPGPKGESVVPEKSGSTTPQRNIVVPQVSISDTGYNAMELQQKTDLLKDIQKIVKNEILANRMTTPMFKEKEKEKEKDKIFSADDSEESDCTMQGKEYESQKNKGEEEYRCPKNPDGSCPPVPDMSQYIKKDAIPCWGCSLQY